MSQRPAPISVTLSVITPMYNERAVVDQFVNRLRPVLEALAVPYEVIAVDDGSRDGTLARLMELRAGWPALRVVALRRNAGHQAALAAGLRGARGEYVVTLDADLQDPPELIGEMLNAAYAKNADVVYGVRSDRSTDTAFKRYTAGAYYWVMRRVAGPWVSDQAGDFRLMSRAVVNVLNALPEQHPVYRLIVPSLGFPSAEVRYARAERVAGQTKYPLRQMIKLSVDSITGYSAAPLRLATWLGVISFLVCLALIIGAVVAWGGGVTVPGWTSLYIAVLLLGAIQLICLGLLGTYVGRIYAAIQNRPQFLVAFDTDTDTDTETDPGPAVATTDTTDTTEPADLVIQR